MVFKVKFFEALNIYLKILLILMFGALSWIAYTEINNLKNRNNE